MIAGLANTVLLDPAEASVNAPRFTEARRPRLTGVLSGGAVPLREDQELRRPLLAWFFRGYLVRYQHIPPAAYLSTARTHTMGRWMWLESRPNPHRQAMRS